MGEGCEEPIKIAYDCGMGREFAQEELEESFALQPARMARRHLAHRAATIAGRAPSNAGTILTPAPIRWS